MTIDESIKHAEEVAEENEQNCKVMNNFPTDNIATRSWKKCAEEHRQLAEWLNELKQKRQAIEDIKAEIESDWQLKLFPRSPFSCGLRRALEIIEKHISGKENYENTNL